MRSQGLTIDRLRAVEMVLADGSLVRASEDERPDLFWGVRGAGAHVGIVTAFEFEAGEVGDVGFAQLVHDVTSDVAGFLERWGDCGRVVTARHHELPHHGPHPRASRVVAQTMNVVDSDDSETVLSRLQPLANTAPLIGQQAQILPYEALVVPPPSVHDAQGQPVSRSGLIGHITPEFAKQAAELLRSGRRTSSRSVPWAGRPRTCRRMRRPSRTGRPPSASSPSA